MSNFNASSNTNNTITRNLLNKTIACFHVLPIPYTIYWVAHFNFSTLITQKGSIFPQKNTREESCIILREEEVSDFEFDLKSIFQGYL